jgi:hypothetical protein
MTSAHVVKATPGVHDSADQGAKEANTQRGPLHPAADPAT